MKFRYKKGILIVTMCTMCIGMVTISLTAPKSEKVYNNKNALTNMSDDATLMSDAGVSEKESDLQKSKVDDIDNLVETYLNSTLICDMDTLEKIVTNTEYVDEEELKDRQKKIENYQNIECYTVDGIQKGEYLVYVYSEYKFVGIDTAAPGLNRLYVITDEEGNLKIELGVLSQEVQAFIDKTDESEDVQKIIETVNYKLEEAINKDEKLRAFYSSLNGGSDEVDSESEMEATDETMPTDEPLEDTEIVNE